ncbi:MAG: hypothetical protein IJS56_03985 [Bacilli bacterium]|nr:hypothetical protein [Bacilli bacterium]
MKIKDLIFRKISLLYVFIIALISFELFIVGNYTISLRASLDADVRSNLVLLSFNEAKKEISGGEIISETKNANYVLGVDESLSGNECIAYNEVLRLKSVGDELDLVGDNNTNSSCVIKEFRGYSIGNYQVLVSKDFYENFKDDGYSYLVKLNSLNSLNKYQSDDKVDVKLVMINTTINNFYDKLLQYEENVFLVGISVIILAMIIIILFVNTSSYIKHNTKKTRKKDNYNKAILNIRYSTLMIALGIIISYIFASLLYFK